MKSTYRLLSLFLDRQALPDKEPVLADSSEYDETDDICSERNLLDFPVCIRKVSAMFLLGQESFQQVETIIEKVDCRMTLVILLDYHAECEVANRLFIKRTLQMVEMIKKRYPRASFMLAAPASELMCIRALVSNIFMEDISRMRARSR